MIYAYVGAAVSVFVLFYLLAEIYRQWGAAPYWRNIGVLPLEIFYVLCKALRLRFNIEYEIKRPNGGPWPSMLSFRCLYICAGIANALTLAYLAGALWPLSVIIYIWMYPTIAESKRGFYCGA